MKVFEEKAKERIESNAIYFYLLPEEADYVYMNFYLLVEREVSL